MKKGITLVALVVTIIILLILATVTISLILGENSLFNRTREGQVKTELTQVGERLQNASTAMITDILSGVHAEPTSETTARNLLEDYVSPADEGKFDGTDDVQLSDGTWDATNKAVTFTYVSGDYTLSFVINFNQMSAIYTITP